MPHLSDRTLDGADLAGLREAAGPGGTVELTRCVLSEALLTDAELHGCRLTGLVADATRGMGCPGRSSAPRRRWPSPRTPAACW